MKILDGYEIVRVVDTLSDATIAYSFLQCARKGKKIIFENVKFDVITKDYIFTFRVFEE